MLKVVYAYQKIGETDIWKVRRSFEIYKGDRKEISSFPKPDLTKFSTSLKLIWNPICWIVYSSKEITESLFLG